MVQFSLCYLPLLVVAGCERKSARYLPLIPLLVCGQTAVALQRRNLFRLGFLSSVAVTSLLCCMFVFVTQMCAASGFEDTACWPETCPLQDTGCRLVSWCLSPEGYEVRCRRAVSTAVDILSARGKDGRSYCSSYCLFLRNGRSRVGPVLCNCGAPVGRPECYVELRGKHGSACVSSSLSLESSCV